MNIFISKATVLTATTLALLITVTACSRAPESAAEPRVAFSIDHDQWHIPDNSPVRSRLVIEPVEVRNVPYSLVLPATVEANPARTINIFPPLTGKVLELKVGLGDRVKRGQVLAVIASGDLAQAYADDDKARDALDLAKKTLDRAHGVKEAGAAAVKDIEVAESNYTQALAEFNRAEQRLESLGGSPELKGQARQMEVTSPANGSITALSIAVGAYVNDPTAAIMTVSNLDSVWVTANVPENNVGAITPGDEVDITLSAYPGHAFHGTVSFVDAVLEPDTRRDKVRIALANADGRLKPNMFANATFKLPQPQAVFVPQSALLMNNDNVMVFVEVSEWTFERRTVELGDDEGDTTRIVKGLKAGDRVIVRGGVLIND